MNKTVFNPRLDYRALIRVRIFFVKNVTNSKNFMMKPVQKESFYQAFKIPHQKIV